MWRLTPGVRERCLGGCFFWLFLSLFLVSSQSFETSVDTFPTFFSLLSCCFSFSLFLLFLFLFSFSFLFLFVFFFLLFSFSFSSQSFETSVDTFPTFSSLLACLLYCVLFFFFLFRAPRHAQRTKKKKKITKKVTVNFVQTKSCGISTFTAWDTQAQPRDIQTGKKNDGKQKPTVGARPFKPSPFGLPPFGLPPSGAPRRWGTLGHPSGLGSAPFGPRPLWPL